MGELLVQLIPTGIVGALAVAPITIVITMLISKDGLAKAVGFAVGLVGVFAVIGVIVLATASTNAGSNAAKHADAAMRAGGLSGPPNPHYCNG